jgi:GT2 family glycosyltransferase
MTGVVRKRSVTVVIPVRNGAATIAEQLDALCDQAAQCREIVVVDNGSTDDTLAVVGAFLPRIANLRILDASDRRGLPEVRNHAAAATDGDLLLCDADDIVSPGWVRAMAEALEDYDIVGGRVEEYSLNGPGTRPRTAQSDSLPVPWDHLPYAVGANAGFRREVIDGVGGWNPRYDTAGEDIDVCWRALHAGFRIGFVPEAVVHYRHRSEMRDVRAQQIRYGRAAARLHRDYRRLGLRRGPLSGPARVWGKVAVSAPLAIVRPEYRTIVHIALGYGWGSTTGMLTERAWPY